MITEAEEKLLTVLKKDVRASISDIARELKISRATVHVRIEKLERIGVIKGYSLELGKNYLNNFISAHVSIATQQEKSLQVRSTLLKTQDITEVHSVNGEYDLIAVIKTKTSENLDDILHKIATIEGVLRTNSSIILTTRYSD
ncbi:Lrp/AsnC family transcriptional regulator [Cognaticolwellia beringensis]|uniref:Lrp/AsnC family transcriptional regulator n=1 Tax=Cognaticolwellia beringensis TaxID=1967665 RepID=A0A222GAB1_9GAMM|nr:Lrp/AsnC family transcriptional regulator [Cognaticolwellia beringensis]ASP48819.1 Lrp/AsnC family transcriptional regulator [Cognaticolwellia beringensis]